MQLEIERKFLVFPELLPNLNPSEGAHLRQGYLSFAPAVRVRHKSQDEGAARGWITIKGPGSIERMEFEYEIPSEDALALLELCAARIEKIRYKLDVNGGLWEVDQFFGAHEGLWLAEIELRSADAPFTKPHWISREVSLDPRFTNAALARAGTIPNP